MVVRHANPEKNPVTVDDYNYKRRGGICFWQTFRFSTFNRRSSWTKVKTRIAFDRQNVFVGLKRVKRKCEMKEGRVALLFLLHPSISSLYWLHWKQALSRNVNYPKQWFNDAESSNERAGLIMFLIIYQFCLLLMIEKRLTRVHRKMMSLVPV
jgi:hypothetical protein